MTKARLLAVSGASPWPSKGGFSLRAAHLLEHLAADWTISLVVGEEFSEQEVGLDLAHHQVVAAPVRRNRRSVPPLLSSMAPLSRTVAEVTGSVRPQAAILFNGSEFLAFGRNDLPPAVADRIDCGTLERIRYLTHAPTLKVVKTGYEILRNAVYERRVLRSLAATVVVGEDDRKALERLAPGRAVYVIANGVEVRGAPNFRREHPQPTVIFTGTLSYYANVDAIEHFCRTLWPGVHERIPSARCLIVGRDPDKRIRLMQQLSGIEIRSNVSDIRDHIEEAWVAVAPMRVGTGVKNKVLEAWSVGRPVVMTPVAANGLVLDEHARELVRKDDEHFRDVLISLLGDSNRRRALGQASYRLVSDHHSWKMSATEMTRLLKRVSSAEHPPKS